MGRTARPNDLSSFSGLFARGAAVPEADQVAFLQAMLDFEAALLGALADVGLAPPQAADELAAVADASSFDLAEIGRSSADSGTPVQGLLAAVRASVSAQTAAHLHRGATSQDVIDTATMLVARRALARVDSDLAAAADACAALADQHRQTLAVGRTLLQQALPLPFGFKAVTWLSGIEGARSELERVRERELALQLGGAVGTLASLGEQALEVVARVAARLELLDPVLPWHTIRLRPARLACALGMALGVMAKIAGDLILLAQTEVGELAPGREGLGGGSSTMPHKRNPVGAVAVVACAQRAPGLVATMLWAMVQEHERAAGAWQAETETILELLRLAGSAAAALRETLTGLHVDVEQMRANLEVTGGLTMSESVATALGPVLGRRAAHQLVQRVARRSQEEGRSFRELLLDQPEVVEGVGARGIEDALDPRHYLGVSEELISRTLRAHSCH